MAMGHFQKSHNKAMKIARKIVPTEPLHFSDGYYAPSDFTTVWVCEHFRAQVYIQRQTVVADC